MLLQQTQNTNWFARFDLDDGLVTMICPSLGPTEAFLYPPPPGEEAQQTEEIREIWSYFFLKG